MNISPDLDAVLCARYPVLLQDRQAPMAVSPMHFGFTCDDGWFLLLNGHFADLQSLADEGRIPQPVASQVKQKYGQLRVYLKSPTQETLALAETLRLTSAITCEKCGAPGLLRWLAGVKTLCDDHAPFGTPVVWPQPPLETSDAR